jgi:hypothetical protein
MLTDRQPATAASFLLSCCAAECLQLLQHGSPVCSAQLGRILTLTGTPAAETPTGVPCCKCPSFAPSAPLLIDADPAHHIKCGPTWRHGPGIAALPSHLLLLFCLRE